MASSLSLLSSSAASAKINSTKTAEFLSSHAFTSSQPSSLTVFAASDEPIITICRYHLVAAALPLQLLKSLPPGTKIPSMLAGHFLTVTTLPSDDLVSINNVTIGAAPIYEDDSLIIYAVDKLLGPNPNQAQFECHCLKCSAWSWNTLAFHVGCKLIALGIFAIVVGIISRLCKKPHRD